MIGVTKILTNFTSGIGKNLDVNSSLSNVVISNLSDTETISVSMKITSAGNTAIPLAQVKIPPFVTLQILEGEPLRIQQGKGSILYDSPTGTPNLMNVVYTSS